MDIFVYCQQPRTGLFIIWTYWNFYTYKYYLKTPQNAKTLVCYGTGLP